MTTEKIYSLQELLEYHHHLNLGTAKRPIKGEEPINVKVEEVIMIEVHPPESDKLARVWTEPKDTR